MKQLVILFLLFYTCQVDVHGRTATSAGELCFSTTLNDSLLTSQDTTRQKYPTYKYILDELEKDKALLVTSNLEQELQIEKSKNRNRLYVMIGIVLGITAIALFYVQKQRARQSRLIERYATESRLSKRLHDELANEVYNLMSDLEVQQVDPKTIDKLDTIYQRTRDISKEHITIDSNAPFVEMLNTLLSGLVPENARLVLRGLTDVPLQQLSQEKKTELYRALQELMVNMKRHSKATLISIAFENGEASKTINISYKDNGIGLPKNLTSLSGLENVDSRIKAVKGTFTFDRKSRQGFTAMINLPT